MPSVRWGIAGPGRIAHLVAPDFAHVPNAELVAVGSRTRARAEAFAAQHGVARAYGSYAELVADPELDVVYIATPHPQHHAIALAALDADKAVLVEKAFTATLAGAREVVSRARERRVFAMEAMWTRFQPAVVRLRELVAAGAIGDLVSVQVDLGISRAFDPSDRLFAAELGGGALLDLGVYVVSFAQMLLGAPRTVAAVGGREPNGVEASASLLLGFDHGRSATLTTSLHAPLPGAARVFGTLGHLELPPRFHHPTGSSSTVRAASPRPPTFRPPAPATRTSSSRSPTPFCRTHGERRHAPGRHAGGDGRPRRGGRPARRRAPRGSARDGLTRRRRAGLRSSCNPLGRTTPAIRGHDYTGEDGRARPSARSPNPGATIAPGWATSSSATSASVVSRSAATDAAFCRLRPATRTGPRRPRR